MQGAPLPSLYRPDERRHWAKDAIDVVPKVAIKFQGVPTRTISSFRQLAELGSIFERLNEALPATQVPSLLLPAMKDLDDLLVAWVAEGPISVTGPCDATSTPNVFCLRLVGFYCPLPSRV